MMCVRIFACHHDARCVRAFVCDYWLDACVLRHLISVRLRTHAKCRFVIICVYVYAIYIYIYIMIGIWNSVSLGRGFFNHFLFNILIIITPNFFIWLYWLMSVTLDGVHGVKNVVTLLLLTTDITALFCRVTGSGGKTETLKVITLLIQCWMDIKCI